MLRVAAAAAVLAFAAAPALAADGAQLFNMQCKMCHGGSPMGPSLVGIAGTKIGEGTFAFSPALKNKGGTWTDANLDAFLKSPSTFAPGTKMMISVPNDENRAALVSYIKTLK
ncbi:c-type cytochrome [Phenylobacterium sp.]|uniref:c-type cytochrome n=1 Tax=Phenylobacterium sp. TaxID=1871053 RepID=UPI0025FDB025|nr:c-type cytochrome [Phenylobacterium sp.]